MKMSGEFPVDEYGMRLRTGLDPQMRMEVETGDSGPTSFGEADAAAMARGSEEPTQETTTDTTDPATTETTTETGEEDLDLMGLDTSDLDETGEPTGDDDDDPELEALLNDENVQEFKRAYVEKLRDKNAKQRQELRDYKDTFSAWPEGGESYVLGLLKNMSSTDEAAARNATLELLSFGKRVLGEDSGEEGTPSTEGEDDLDRPLTRRELQEEREREAASKAQNDAIQQVFKDADELGYTDPAARRFFLGVLAYEAGGDKVKADNMVKNYNKNILRQYIEGKKQQAATATTVVPTGGETTEAESHDPDDWESADRAAMARINSKVGK